MSDRYVVGKPNTFYVIGIGDVTHYPIFDTENGRNVPGSAYAHIRDKEWASRRAFFMNREDKAYKAYQAGFRFQVGETARHIKSGKLVTIRELPNEDSRYLVTYVSSGDVSETETRIFAGHLEVL